MLARRSPAGAGTALMLSIASVALMTPGVFIRADDTRLPRVVTLPPLANTAETDRLMSQEIGDQEQFSGAPGIDKPSLDAAPPVPINENNALTTPSDGGPVAAVPDGPDTEFAPADVAGTESAPFGAPLEEGPARLAPTLDETPDLSEPWERIRNGTRLPVGSHESIDAFRQGYIDEALWVGRIFERSRPYIAYVVNELDERFLPVELALLPAIESGYRPNVHSSGQAAGLWQIVPITADEIGLKRTAWFDARADIISSTTAAIDYLSFLSAEFNADWELILAAYNAGPGRVRRAMLKNAAADLPTDFWSLDLPQETRAYVPKLLALVQLFKQENSPVPLPDLDANDGFELVDIGQRISIAKAAEIAGVDREQLELLNAHLTLGVTEPQGPHVLYFPPNSADGLRQKIASLDPQELFSLPDTHKVLAGDTLSGIAYRYGMSQRQLMSINGLHDSNIRSGQTLTVHDVRSGAVGEIEYVVTIGDTLSSIADRHSVTTPDILDAAGEPLASDVIHPGETLTILVDLGTNG